LSCKLTKSPAQTKVFQTSLYTWQFIPKV